MSTSLALEVLDMSRMQSLVMPAPRAPHRPVASLKHLAPIEMAAKSIHFQQGRPAEPAAVFVSVLPPAVAPDSSPPGGSLSLQGWAIPVGYAACGLSMGLCNLISPSHVRDCAHLLCPPWTLTLGMHIVTQGAGGVWGWWGVMTILLLPFVTLVRDPLFVAFYLLVFTGFVLARFWVHTQGPQFLLACVCCVGVLAGCGLSLAVDQPQAQLSVATFFAISAGVVGSSRLGKTAIRVG